MFWNSFVNFKKLRFEHPLAYSQHFAKKCNYINEIEKDLDRTLPEYDRYSTHEG